jgi:gamma-glutamyl-gamma-aminobutyrate hydrolase PuuD
LTLKVAITISNLKKAAAYQNAVEQTGLECVLNPDTMDGFEGLLLAGGADVNPAMYGEQRHPKTEEPDDERDARELLLLQAALDRDLPVLGICRGHQFLNVAFGGKLVQHLPNCEVHVQKSTDYAHDVVVLPDSMLGRILERPAVGVNSRHHQGVDVPAPGLISTAVSPSDNLVEALEVPGKRFVLSVQWHPEDRTHHEEDRRIFEAFAEAVRCRHPQKP